MQHDERLRRKSRYSDWTSEQMDRADEKRAAQTMLEVLRTLEIDWQRARCTDEPLHRVIDLGQYPAPTVRFMLNNFSVGEVRITLHSGQAVVTETKVPGLWRLAIGQQESLVAALLPRSVEVLLDAGIPKLPVPEDKPEGLFAADAILAEVDNALSHADLETVCEGLPEQIDMLRQPLTPTDKSYLLATVGEGPLMIELLGFADSRIYSTKVRGLWRTLILNPAGKPLLDSLTVTRIPPEVPASREDLADGAAKLADMREWLENDLKRGAFD